MKNGILILCLLLSSTANASLYLGGGAVQRTQPADGIWWQSNYNNEFDLRDRVFSIGVESKINDYWTIRGGYIDLGKYHTSAYATPEEDAIALGTCNVFTCRAPDLYTTEGSTRAFELAIEVRQPGKQGFLATAGLLYVRQSFWLTAKGETPDSQYGENGYYHYRETRHGGGYEFGVGYFYKNLTALVSVYNTGADDFNNKSFPSATEPMIVAQARYAFN